MTSFTEILEPVLSRDSKIENLRWLQHRDLINLNVLCSVCRKTLNLQKLYRNIDGYILGCNTNECSGKRISIRKNPFFEKWKCSLQQAIKVIWGWSQCKLMKLIAEETGISYRTVGDYWHLIREKICRYFQDNRITLVVEGVPIEIDESCFRHKSKFGRGRQPDRELWVFGMADRSHSSSISYMEVVENRSEENLLPIIEVIVTPGIVATIHSDCWAAYNRICERLGHHHFRVNHSDRRHNFIAPDGIHTQGIESHWNKWKSYLKKY